MSFTVSIKNLESCRVPDLLDPLTILEFESKKI